MSELHPMRVWRKAERKTLAEIAKRAHVSPGFLSDVERFKKQPSLTVAAKLTEISGVPLDKFVKQIEAAE